MKRYIVTAAVVAFVAALKIVWPASATLGVVTAVPAQMTGPRHTAINATTHRVYVVKEGGAGVVSVFDTTNNSFIANIGVGINPNDVAVNEVTDRVYVVNGDSQSMSIIDGATNTVVSTISIPFCCVAGLAVDSTTNRVFVGGQGLVVVFRDVIDTKRVFESAVAITTHSRKEHPQCILTHG